MSEEQAQGNHSGYEFKPQLPIEHVKHIILMVKEGVPSKGELLMCVGATAGEVGALVASFENPDVVPFGSPVLTQMTEQEVIQELEDALDGYNPELSQISPFVLALIMKAIEIAMEYLKNR